jgi:predicted  nucleic acid-binding Zn-ribbon protein
MTCSSWFCKPCHVQVVGGGALESLALSIRMERRWPLWCVLAIALVWLGVAGFEILQRTPPGPDAREIAGVMLALLPPLGLALLAITLLPGAGQTLPMVDVEARLADATRTVGDLQLRLGDVDALLGASAERTERLVVAASGGGTSLAASAAALEQAAARVVAGGLDTQRLTEQFRSTLPEIAQTIGNVDATLRAVSADSGTQLRAVETMLAAVQGRNREAAVQADTAIANMTTLLARIDEASSRNTATLSKRAYALDAAVDGVLERTAATVDHIRNEVEARLEALRTGVEASAKQMAFFGDDSARLFNQRLELLLRTSEQMKVQFAGHEAGSERLQATIEAQLQALEGRYGEVGAAGAAVSDAMRAAASAHFGALEAKLAAVRADGTGVAEAIGTQIAAIDTGLREAAAAQLAAFEARLAEVRAAGTAAVDDIGTRATTVDAKLRAAAMERAIELEQRFAELRTASTAATEDIGARIGAIAANLGALETPLVATQSALAGLDGQSAALREAVTATEGDLATRLAATRTAMGALEAEANRLFAAVSALRDSVGEGAQLVGEAASGFAGERAEVERLAARLDGHFETARATLADIRSGSAEAATAAAAALTSEFARMQQAADNAAGTMRHVLTGVIDDTVAALHVTAASHAELAFGDPIRAQLTAIEGATARAGSAGQHAAERLAGHMVNLVETVSMVDAQVGEIETRFTIRARDSLAARSARLIGQLNTSLIDVQRLLAMPIKDDDWAQYLKGDRSVFARTMAPKLDREASRQMARMYQHDAEFREEASRYVDTFETLIQRLLGDRDGEAFAATMLSSDIGKIYVAIAEATDRLPPSRSIN